MCSLPRPKESEATQSGRKRLSAVEILFENAKEHQKHLREDTVEKPLDLLHVEAAGQSGLAEDIFRFEDTTLKNVSMTSILLDNKWIVMGTKDGDVVLYVVCVNTHIEEQQLTSIHTHTHSGTITTTTNEPHWSHQNMRKTKALQL